MDYIPVAHDFVMLQKYTVIRNTNDQVHKFIDLNDAFYHDVIR